MEASLSSPGRLVLSDLIRAGERQMMDAEQNRSVRQLAGEL